jgi:hypothetical protein
MSGQVRYLGSPNKHTVTISGRNVYDRTLYEKVIENVYISPNKVTILQGTLYDAPVGGSPMILTADADYADSVVVKF